MLVSLPNRPRDLPEDPDRSPVSEVAILARLGLQPHEIGSDLWNQHQGVSWVEALKVSETALQRPPDVDPTQVLRSYSLVPSPPYLLMIAQGQVKVLHALRPCLPLAAGGARVAGLLGERVKAGATVIPPPLVVTSSPINEQGNHFGRVEGQGPSYAGLEEFYSQANAPALWRADEHEGAELLPGSSWRAIPVHPKLAALFLRGVPIPEALLLIGNLYRSWNPEARLASEAVLTFIRLASVGADEAHKSILETEWVIKNHMESAELTEWYLQVVNNYTPGQTLPPLPVGILPPPQGQTESIEAMNAIADRVLGGLASTQTGKRGRELTPSEVDYLLWLCGVPEWDEANPGESLPEFWRDVPILRARPKEARSVVENYFLENFPEGRAEQNCFFSPKVVQALIRVDFAGGDQTHSYEQRLDGLTPWTIGPYPETFDTSSLRAAASHYEDTIDNHRPGDRAAMENLSDRSLVIPTSRLEFLHYVEFMATWAMVFFTSRGILPRGLDSIHSHLKKLRLFSGHGPSDWRIYFWRLHVSMRELFGPDQSAENLNALIRSIRLGERLIDNCPKEMRPGVEKDQSPQIPRVSPVSRTDSPRSETRTPPPEFTHRFKDDLDLAKEALEKAGKEFNSYHVYGGRNEIARIMGGEFPKLVKGGRPCAAYFLLGRECGKRCRNGHQFTRPPSEKIIDGVVSRAKANIAKAIAHPGKDAGSR